VNIRIHKVSNLSYVCDLSEGSQARPVATINITLENAYFVKISTQFSGQLRGVMSDKTSVKPAKEEYYADGKAQYLQTAGGNITCLRCTAQSTRTKLQCGRPAIKTSRTQKCQYHGGRPHTAETLKRISEANMLHGQATKQAKEQYRHSIELIHELQDAMHVLEMGDGPKIRGPKPKGYKPVMTQADVVRMIRERLLHLN
jgi:hypothetical protein